MPVVSMKQLLEAGVHFGHQVSRWNPKMKKYIYAARNDIHVIDLHKTIPLIDRAYEFVKQTAADNGLVLFVGTKKQAQEAIAEEAVRCGMFYVNERWLGGMLTNFKTIKRNIARLKEIEKMEADGLFNVLPPLEVADLKREHAKLQKSLGGIRDIPGLPSILFVVDTKKEQIAVAEARKLQIPIVAIVDTNADPDEVQYPIPGNDDAIRAIKLFAAVIADAVLEGRSAVTSLGEIPEGEEAPAQEVPEELQVADEIALEEELEKLDIVRALEKKKEEDELEEEGLA